SIGCVRDMVRPVAPGAEDALAGFEVRDRAADFDDLAGFLIAEVSNRVGPARCVGIDEQSALLVPPPVHERVRSPVLRQLGSGADARVKCGDTNFIGSELAVLDRLERKLARRVEDKGASAVHAGTSCEFASTARRVGSRIASRMMTATK